MKNNTETDEAARAAALRLLRDGTASPAEVARLAGVSRQLVNFWVKSLNWRKARSAYLSKAWRKALRA